MTVFNMAGNLKWGRCIWSVIYHFFMKLYLTDLPDGTETVKKMIYGIATRIDLVNFISKVIPTEAGDQ